MKKKNILFLVMSIFLAGVGLGGVVKAECGSSDLAHNTTKDSCYSSLRIAIGDANSGDVIEMLGDDNVSFDINNLEIVINKALTIDGKGFSVYGINDYNYWDNTNGGNDHDIFISAAAGDVAIKNLRITEFGGNAYVAGMGIVPIYVSGNYGSVLTLESVTIDDFNNRAMVLGGGTVVISGCVVTGDAPEGRNASGEYFQQGIDTYGATVTVINTTVTDMGAKDDTYGTSDEAGAVQLTTTGKITIKSGTFSGDYGLIVAAGATGEGIEVEDGTINGILDDEPEEADSTAIKIFVKGGSFDNPFYKTWIKDNDGTKCAVKGSDNRYTIGTCPKSTIMHDSDAGNLEGTSPDAIVTVDGYNVTVSGPINYYNKAANNGNGHRYGLVITPWEGIDDDTLNGATYTLNGAHWSNVSGPYSGDMGGFNGFDNSLFAYPKLTADNKSTPLTLTVNWGDYYGTETFTVNHSAAELNNKITVTFDTDGGDAIDPLVFSGTDLQDGINNNIKVGDLVAAPNKTGYTFVNWYLSGNDAAVVYDTGSVIETDIVLKANYTGKDITLTFSIDGALTLLTGKAGDPFVTPPTLSKSCYNGSWNPSLPSVIPAEDTTYTATWTYTCGGGGGSTVSSSSYSCKNLPANATANNTTTPKSDTNYSYSTDTTKVCTFQCKSGYAWNSTSSKCEKEEVQATTGDTAIVDEPTEEGNGENTNSNSNPQEVLDNGFTREFNDAYEFAFKNGITTMPDIENADMEGELTRIAMAKMLSNYGINVLGKEPANVEVPEFVDVSAELNEQYGGAVTLAYQLGIMGINMPDNKFRPFDTVTRAEFGTALSRLLFGLEDGVDAYYTTHLAKLKAEGIITNDDPTLQELRGYVMIMLMRSANR